MARAAPQSQPNNRSSSSSTSSSRQSRQPSSSSIQPTPDLPTSTSTNSSSSHPPKTSNNNAGNNNKKLTSTSILPALLTVPLVILHFLYSILKLPFEFGSYSKKSTAELQEDGSTAIVDDPESSNEDDDSTNLAALLLKQQSESSSDNEQNEYLSVKASPALTTLLDDALYRAYQAELVPTVAAASRLLTEFIEMKEAAALVWRECRWMVGVPMSGGLDIVKLDPEEFGDEEGEEAVKEVAIGTVRNNIFFGGGVLADGHGNPYFSTDDSHKLHRRGGSNESSSSSSSSSSNNITTERLHSEEMNRWNEFDTIQDFAQQCYLSANEAIQRLTTDRLAESANLTLQDSIAESSEKNGGQKVDALQQQSQTSASASPSALPGSSTLSASSSTFPSSPADAGIGRCYHPQPRRNCWESPRLYCPDYYWADDAIGGCQRLLKTLSKHRFVSLVGTNGWDRYSSGIKDKKKSMMDDSDKNVQVKTKKDDWHTHYAPTYASSTPHVFPSLETVHSLQYLVSHLLPTSIPSRLNQFRAAVESNAVVSKRLYLVKCEYRAPMRALWESYGNLNAAPKAELVERYLREYHGVKKIGEKVIGSNSENATATAAGGGGSANSNSESSASSGGKSAGSLRRKGSAEVTKKSAIQQQREKLEKLITEKYWKHPAFVEALQLERCCERMEIEMSQMLLPLANLATEIMNEWKGRLRAVTVIDDGGQEEDEEEYKDHHEDDDEDSNEGHDTVRVLLGWRDVPFMRELLRRLKSILRRKPDLDESTGIRPLLLDLQGIPRRKQDPTDSSIEMPFYPPRSKPSLFERFTTSEKPAGEKLFASPDNDQWFHLEQFLSEVSKLLELLTLPNIPFLVEERMTGSKGDKNTLLGIIEQCEEVWDEEMFRAQYKDWFDMVKRQQELNAGGGAGTSGTDNSNNMPQESPPTSSLSELSETIREAEIELSIAMASKDQLERVHKRLEALRADKVARYKVLAHIVFDVGYRELNDGIVVEPPSEDDATVEFPRLSSVPGVFGDQLTMSGEELPVG